MPRGLVLFARSERPFHIRIAPHHRPFLRFTFEGVAYQYTVLFVPHEGNLFCANSQLSQAKTKLNIKLYLIKQKPVVGTFLHGHLITVYYAFSFPHTCQWFPSSCDLNKNRFTLQSLFHWVDADVIEQTRAKVTQGHWGGRVRQVQLSATRTTFFRWCVNHTVT